MDTRLTVLSAFLRALGQPLDIATKDDRLRTQKAVYLGQLTGVDLGYRYNWYVHGPYSPSLTQDYYALDALSGESRAQANQTFLNAATIQKLAGALPLFQIPAGVNLQLHNWLELLCSWHYLRKIVGYAPDKARATLTAQKPHVAQYVDQADAVLAHEHFL
ncbi:hypothetical protein [Mesorhizobium sp. ISC15]|uniref:hypothetical protein n=1 Tax=Mesorhizobium sp. ISC15 TaxID=3076429 RepID=UPI00301DC0E4